MNVWCAVVLAAAAGGVGCRERAQAVQGDAELKRMVRQMMPAVERATRLRFKTDPIVLRRTRAQVRDYVVHKFDQDLPPAELAGVQAAYRLFGLIPDSLDLRATMVALLTEQIAGYYDPDSGALFVPGDMDDSARARLVISHELIHALQDEYVKLDSLITQHRRNDRRSAAQAVLEGQATFYQIAVLMPEQRPETLPERWFWRQREVMARLQSRMKEFSGAPLWLRETLIFPYLGGADFIGWFARTHPGQQPFGAAMPTSTEQILHPDRYAAGDRPVDLAFIGPAVDRVRYEDGLGEFETRLLFAQLLGDEAEGALLAAGWAGDRYQVLGPDPGAGAGAGADALVWYSVWDDAAAATRFGRGLERAWARRQSSGQAVPKGLPDGRRRSEIKALTVDGRPAVRLVDAPVAWSGWKNLPRVRIGS